MKLLTTIIIVMITGCAAYQPLVDTKGVDMRTYYEDLAECQQYATKVAGPGTGVVVGAVAGALLGVLITRTVDRNLERGTNARLGALIGAGGGAAQGAQNERDVVLRCMSGRGYRVLY